MSGFCHFVSYLAFRQFFSYLTSITVRSVNVASYQFTNGDEWGLLYFLFPERKEAFYYTDGQVSLAFVAWNMNILGRKSKRLLKKEYKKHIWAILPYVCPPTTGQALLCQRSDSGCAQVVLMSPLDLLKYYSCSCSVSSCDGDLHNLILFFFRKPLCFFLRTSLVVLELKDSYSNTIVMKIPFIYLYRLLSNPSSITSFSSRWTLIHSTIFLYGITSKFLYILSTFFCFLPRS